MDEKQFPSSRRLRATQVLTPNRVTDDPIRNRLAQGTCREANEKQKKENLQDRVHRPIACPSAERTATKSSLKTWASFQTC